MAPLSPSCVASIYREMAKYGMLSYWEKRYGDDPDAFEWYTDWETSVGPVVEALGDKDAPLLDVGCGTSGVLAAAAGAGFTHVVGIDAAEAGVDAALGVMGESPAVAIQAARAEALPFENGFFGCVIDKGTLDTTLVAEDGEARARAFVAEARRVLKVGGLYVVVSTEPETVRVPIFTAHPTWKWKISVRSVPRLGSSSAEDSYSMFVLRKLADARDSDAVRDIQLGELGEAPNSALSSSSSSSSLSSSSSSNP